MRLVMLQPELRLRAGVAGVIGAQVAELARRPGVELDWSPLEGMIERREPLRRIAFRIHGEAGGTAISCIVSGEPMYDDEVFVGYRGTAWNTSDKEQLLERISASELRFRTLTRLSAVWYWEMDQALRMTAMRGGGARRRQFDEGQVVGRPVWDLVGEVMPPATLEQHRAILAAREPFRDMLIRRWRSDGGLVYFTISGDPTFDRDGTFCGYRGIGRDVSEQIRAQERIEQLATLDPLTQLPNRQAFDERAQTILSDAYADGRNCALLFVDLDNFRLLNNGYGHRVGDQLLAIVANRISTLIGPAHVLGRRGGDEIVLLLVDIARPEVAIETAKKIIAAVSEPARTLGIEVSVTPSIGIAFFPVDGVDLDSLLNAADAAMYQAKEGGRRTYALYTPSVARRVDLRLRLEQRLRRAVETRDFRLFYQPLVSMADGRIIGAEALLRWNDAELGDISPGEFVPIAEESGLIVALGDWVLREACRARRKWHQIGLDVPPVAVNVSGVQLRQIGFVENVLGVLAEHDVAPGEVEVEVTETGLQDMSALSRENLLRLRNAGVKIALDDFGVGTSSLAHLRDLPIHRLKIDRSFTVECMRDARTLTIVKAVVEMARSLGLNVTAEGIETQAQQTWMQHLGCDSAQGYLFARPMNPEDFLRVFVDRRGRGGERSLMH